MNDYIPFMDQHPELKLVPATSVKTKIKNFPNRFDYVQDLNRKGDKGSKELFHLLVKDGKFGVLMHSSGLFSSTDSIALPAVYDSVFFLFKKEKSFGAIIQLKGKFGLYFWEYGSFKNSHYTVQPEYDSMELLDNKRLKGVKDGNITYFDETGHILK